MQSQSVQTNFSFVKGYITEAGPLTFPENAAKVLENFVVNVDGSVKRRLGIKADGAGTVLPQTTISDLDNNATIFLWTDVDGYVGKKIVCVLIGGTIYFFDYYTVPISSGYIGYVNITTASDIVTMSQALGKLIVPTYTGISVYTYNGTSVVFSSTNPIKIRDYFGLSASEARPKRSGTISAIEKYDLYNSGWNDTDIEKLANTRGVKTWKPSFTYVVGDLVAPFTTDYTYVYSCTKAGTSGDTEPTWGASVTDGAITWTQIANTGDKTYPSFYDDYAQGIGTDGSFDPALLIDYKNSTSPAVRGSVVISAFNRDGTRASYVSAHKTNCTTTGYNVGDVDDAYLTQTTSAFGRLFFSGVRYIQRSSYATAPNFSGTVFFSSILKNESDIWRCHQEVDPADPYDSELLDSDGGYITIPNAYNIVKLTTIRNSVVVWADNGVWAISGSEGGFTSTSYQVTKITELGVLSPENVIDVEGSQIYWNRHGIYNLTPTDNAGQYGAESLSATTIQRYLDTLSEATIANSTAFYDSEEKRVHFLYNENVATDKNSFSTELVYDIRLQAFTKQVFAVDATKQLFSCLPNVPTVNAYANVRIVTSGGAVVLSDGSSVTTSSLEPTRNTGTLTNKYLVLNNASGIYSLYFTDQVSTTFNDWVDIPSGDAGTPYTSTLLTGHNIADDISRNKQVTYATFAFLRTEDGFTDDGLGNLTATNQSSCLVQPRWDFSDHVNWGKFGTQFQAYRYKRDFLPETLSSFNYGQEVITTKNKLRGRGKSIAFKIDSEAGKDMQLLGWSLTMTGNTVV